MSRLTLNGVHKIEIPTSFSVGNINVYILDGPYLSMIDAGIKTDEALFTLERELYKMGRRIEDIKKIYLTHSHVDHCGLSQRISQISGGRVFLHRYDRYKAVSSFKELFDIEYRLYKSYFHEAGLSPSFWQTFVREMEEVWTTFSEPASSVDTIEHGEIVECGERKLKVLHLPGHSRGSLCYLDEDSRILFSGDHLLDRISPNPLLELYSKIEYGYRSLETYLNSLHITRRLDVDLVLPGHGDFIEDHRKLIDHILKHHQYRAERILDTLAEGEKTKSEICDILFGRLEGREVLLGLSEVEGHLELLETRGDIIKRKKNGHLLFYKKG
nr:MBL fold metallo-hydrolase [Desulfobacterales bacterium]